MRILNLTCWGSATLFTIVVMLIAWIYFFTGIYACFSKKVKGDLLAKVIVAIGVGCSIPWLLKLSVFFISKMFA